ncbi:hypothetical protein ACTXT7_013188 [Hymenolepis weldensis]
MKKSTKYLGQGNHIRAKSKLTTNAVINSLPRDFCRDLNISLYHYPPDPNGLDEQLVDNVKRQLLMSQGKETVDEIPNPLQSRYRTTPHVGVQIWCATAKITVLGSQLQLLNRRLI